MKEQLIIYLEAFKSVVNTAWPDRKNIEIELFSGLKPSSYYVPNVLGYLNHPPYSTRGETIHMAWFVEIYINNLCIFRESSTPDNEQDYLNTEEYLIKKTLEQIVFHGLRNAWESTKNRRINK